MTVRGRNSRGDSLACAGTVSVCVFLEEGSFTSGSHERDTQIGVHLIDNAGVDVCSGTRSVEEFRG